MAILKVPENGIGGLGLYIEASPEVKIILISWYQLPIVVLVVKGCLVILFVDIHIYGFEARGYPLRSLPKAVLASEVIIRWPLIAALAWSSSCQSGLPDQSMRLIPCKACRL